MKVDNQLNTAYLSQFPRDAAHVLEQMSSRQVALLVSELAAESSAPLLTAMMPPRAAGCVELLDIGIAVKLIAQMSSVSAARVLRLVSADKRAQLLAQLPAKQSSGIKRHFKYSAASVGYLMQPVEALLPDNINVSEAIRRSERFKQKRYSEIFITNDKHQLVGVLNLSELLTADHHATLSSLMNKKYDQFTAHTEAISLIDHQAWSRHYRLPIVDRNNILLGVLDYAAFNEARVNLERRLQYVDPFSSMLSVGALYWIKAAQILVGMFGLMSQDEGKKREF